MEFQAWPKIARLNRDIVVTEKIDGTNAAIIIEPWANLVERASETWNWTPDYVRAYGQGGENLISVVGEPIHKEFNGRKWIQFGRDAFGVFAQSRKRLISPTDDNFGFAKWVESHAAELVKALGEGRHFGEWWGSGIQIGYNQTKGLKHFSLFNTERYKDVDLEFGDGSRVRPVPVLYQGPYADFDQYMIELGLRTEGSQVVEGFDRPEGFVIFHEHARTMFKVTLENDEIPKGAVQS